MTAKEQVLKVWPDAESFNIYAHVCGVFSNCEQESPIGVGLTEDAAWQNAAESLAAQPEQEIRESKERYLQKHGEYIDPVAPVEAKEKPICATCNEPIYQREEFGDNAWCHTIGGAIMSNGHVAEPKPTPSTHEESASWIVSVTASHPEYLKQFEADLPGERSYGVNRISVRSLPQPDSSSISTEPPPREWEIAIPRASTAMLLIMKVGVDAELKRRGLSSTEQTFERTWNKFVAANDTEAWKASDIAQWFWNAAKGLK